MKRVLENDPVIFDSNNEVIQSVGEGKESKLIGYTPSSKYRERADKGWNIESEPLKMEPVSGVAFMNFVAVVNEAPHPNGAKLLIRYLLGGEDGNGNGGNTVGYRDSRTEGMDQEVYKVISQEELYERTGIQKAIYNTIYQLMSVKTKHPEYLEQAETLLHVPDYFHYLLTGVKSCEYTEATTSQLVSPVTKDWDFELIDKLGYPRKIFQKLIMPGTSIGHFSEAVKNEVGFDLEVVAPATHDTGSAVLAVPANDDDFIYISSGTWSLMGLERETADCSKESCALNLTNEGPADIPQ